MSIDKADAFWIGNVVGVVSLLVVILVVAPQKERERLQHERDVQRKSQQAAAELTAKSKPAKPGSETGSKPNSQAQNSQATVETEIWFATTDIPAGGKINPKSLEKRKPTASESKSHALKTLSPNAIAKHLIHKGQVLLKTDIASSSTSPE